MSNPFSNKEKKFSIMLPVFGITYLDFPKFFESLNKSDYKNFEIIVTFDGPHPKGEKMLKKMMAEYDFDVKYQTIEHVGCTSARNACVPLATGDYYVFTAPDCYLYPETLRIWADAFDEDPETMRVWGLYDVLRADGSTINAIGQVPHLGGKVWYEAFKWSPYADATFPIRKEYFMPWDPDCKSLNDWEWSVRYLKKDNWTGKGWKYIPMSFFIAEDAKPGGLSNDSHSNWEDRKAYVQEHGDVEPRDICVTSLGAPEHGIRTSKLLDAEYLTMPGFKAHHYKAVYLLGFYLREDPANPGFVTRSHMDVFARNKGKNIVHWVGTDIYDLRWHCSFEKIKALKSWFKKNKVIHLCEAEFTQKELAEVGIKAKIVPIPPEKLYEPMPLPKEFIVGIYLPSRDLYNPQLMEEVIRAMPDVKFYLFGDESRKGQKGDNWDYLGYIDFDKWIPKMSANLRVTSHDGLPLTPLQFFTAGRNVITNVDLKGAIKVEANKESIVKGIRKAQKEPLDPKVAEYWNEKLDKDIFVNTIRGLI
jgi:glycosyltransferase involved in cell wall biosynthesis